MAGNAAAIAQIAARRAADSNASDTVTLETAKAPSTFTQVEMVSLCLRAKALVAKKTTNSKLLSEPRNHFIMLTEDEITTSKVLGRGGFCSVSEVSEIKLEGEIISEQAQKYKVNGHCNDLDEQQVMSLVQTKVFMSEHCRRGDSKDCRYAIKKLHSACYDDKNTLLNGIVDLAVEVKFLSVVNHYSIIKLRAVSGTSQPGDDNFFVVLDRLYDTLTVRMQKWKRQQRVESNGWNKLIRAKRSRERLTAAFSQRICFANDIANALKYLHSLNIMYRDIKPDNIGFDVRGDIKLFDFGLAREYDTSRCDPVDNYYHHLTKDTGSPRYMDPRVALGLPYNELCDVYSFSILLWELLELSPPFIGYNMNSLKKKVYEGGYRPKIDSNWPLGIQKILMSGFGDMSTRMNINDVCKELRKTMQNKTELSCNNDDDDNDDEDCLGRSDRSDRSRVLHLTKQKSIFNLSCRSL